MTERGITRAVAQQLAQTLDAATIRLQLDVFDWLKDHQPSRLGKNPPGYLRKAIEQSYQPPPGYKSPQQRQAEAERRVHQLELEQAQEQAEREAWEQEREAARQALSQEYPPQPIPGTELTTALAWQKALVQLASQMSKANYNTWLRDTTLARVDGQTALIVVPSPFQAEELAKRFSPLIQRELQRVLGYRPQPRYLAASELGLPSEGSAAISGP